MDMDMGGCLCTVEELTRKTANHKFYARFPEDVALVQRIVSYLASQPEGGLRLPSGTLLTPRAFQTLGLSGKHIWAPSCQWIIGARADYKGKRHAIARGEAGCLSWQPFFFKSDANCLPSERTDMSAFMMQLPQLRRCT
eukprot:scaffold65492_cov21-Tisochrysis_lutea.AAC.1